MIFTDFESFRTVDPETGVYLELSNLDKQDSVCGFSVFDGATRVSFLAERRPLFALTMSKQQSRGHVLKYALNAPPDFCGPPKRRNYGPLVRDLLIAFGDSYGRDSGFRRTEVEISPSFSSRLEEWEEGVS